MLHSLLWLSGAPQASAPPPLTHFLLRVLEPRPHVTEHRLHDDHSSHSSCAETPTGGTCSQWEMKNERRERKREAEGGVMSRKGDPGSTVQSRQSRKSVVWTAVLPHLLCC